MLNSSYSGVVRLKSDSKTILKTTIFLKRLVELMATTVLVENDLYSMIFDEVLPLIDDDQRLAINPGHDLHSVPFSMLLQSRKIDFYLTNLWKEIAVLHDGSTLNRVFYAKGPSRDLDLLEDEIFFLNNISLPGRKDNTDFFHVAAHGKTDQNEVVFDLGASKKSIFELTDEAKAAKVFYFSSCDESKGGGDLLRASVSSSAFHGGKHLVGTRFRPSSESSLHFMKTFYSEVFGEKEPLLAARSAYRSTKEVFNNPGYSANFAYYYVHPLF